MLSISSRSTLHSDVLLYRDITHSPPHVDKVDFSPSTARLENLNEASCCHVGLFKARFSLKTQMIYHLEKATSFNIRGKK